MQELDLDGSLSVVFVPLGIKEKPVRRGRPESPRLPDFALVQKYLDEEARSSLTREDYRGLFGSPTGSGEILGGLELDDSLSDLLYESATSSTVDNLDIGLGLATLVDHRSIELSGKPEVSFGRSRATMVDADARDEWDENIEAMRTRPYVSLGLWETRHGLVLTLEALSHESESIGRSTDVLSGETSDAVRRFLQTFWTELRLEKADATLTACFPEVSWQGGSPRSHEVGDRSLVDLIVPSAERIRGRAVSSGLVLVVEAGASLIVEELLEEPELDFDHIDEEQQRGVARTWESFQLAHQPAEHGARSALREDVRAAFVNQESMSVWHEYGLGLAEVPALGLIPLVAYVARTENSMNELFSLLEELVGTSAAAEDSRDFDDPEVLEQQLDWLRAVRTERLYRTMLLGRTSPEQFREWSLPSTLASYLLTVQQERLADLDGQIEEAAAIVHETVQQVQERVRRKSEARSKKFDRILNIFAPVAGVGLAVTILGELTGMPLPATPEHSETWRLAWIIFAGLLLTGTTVGLVLLRFERKA